MKNQRGVTLIALVVTIIVLIILAAVSIAILTGDNGIIDRSKQAQISNIEGEVRDRITMAIASAKLLSEQNSVSTTNGFLANEDLVKLSTGTTYIENPDSQVLDLLREDLTSSMGYTITASRNDEDSSEIVIVYQTNQYKQATNYDVASIECHVKVTGNSFAFDSDWEDGSNGWKYNNNLPQA